MSVRSARMRNGVKVWTKNRSEGFRGCVVKIFSLLPHSILALFSETSFDAAMAGPLVT